ncbi:hypothetical protein [Pseudomonas sp. P9_31]|uniref:hypothetical protein n=1 Tax=Pseudomonas sp. P9_31 TaxID=3043448 RepID=UPI002A3653E0|nr:hypothetical protein [Pseudomonas sp. P9_31]WPN58971.1 hypothetical protein QMK51_04945 [Pseudomonas sp. P9_31]
MKEGRQDNKKPPGSAWYDAADNACSRIATFWPKKVSTLSANQEQIESWINAGRPL